MLVTIKMESLDTKASISNFIEFKGKQKSGQTAREPRECRKSRVVGFEQNCYSYKKCPFFHWSPKKNLKLWYEVLPFYSRSPDPMDLSIVFSIRCLFFE